MTREQKMYRLMTLVKHGCDRDVEEALRLLDELVFSYLLPDIWVQPQAYIQPNEPSQSFNAEERK